MEREMSALEAERLKRHLSLGEVARHIGIDRATLSRWEKGNVKPRAANLRQLCDEYGMSPQELGLEEDCGTAEKSFQIEEGSEIKAFIAENLTIRLSVLAFGPLMSFQALHDILCAIIEEGTMHMDFAQAQKTRREALRNLVVLPLMAMNLTSFAQGQPKISMKRTEDIITQCSAGIAACRELSKGNDSSDLALAYDGVTAYTPILKAIAKDSSQHRKMAANLVAQCARIKTMLGRIGWQKENIQTALTNALEAVSYAQVADDPALLISSQLSLAWVYYYDHQPKQGLQVLNEALLVLKDHAKSLPTGSLAARIYNTQAVLEARSGQQPINTLRLAHNALQKGASDYFVFTEELLTEFTGNEALIYFYSRDYGKAMDTFGQLIHPDDLTTKKLVSGKGYAEMLNYMTLTSLKQPKKDLARSLLYWDAALASAKQMQSRQRLQEVRAAYDIMEALWSGEKTIEERRDLVLHL